MSFWSKTKQVANSDVSVLAKGNTGARVGSVQVLIAEFTNITNEFKLIEQNLQQINKLSIEEINGLTSAVSSFNLPMFGVVKQKLGMRQGQMSQLYYASKNDETFKIIQEIHQFVETLIKWLIDLSNVTDTKKLSVYFGSGKNSHGTFSTTLAQLSTKIDLINTMVGATIKSDDILINQTSKLSELYKDVALIINLLKDDSKITNKQLFARYREMILSFLGGVLDASNDFDSQIKKISSIIIFNKYICEEYFKVLTDVNENQTYLANLKSLIIAAGKKSFSSSKEVLKFIEKSGFAVTIKKAITNMMDDSEINDMVGSIKNIKIGNPGVHQYYVNFINKFLLNKPFNEVMKTKLKLVHDAIVRDVLTLPVRDDEVDKYAVVFNDIFTKFDLMEVHNDVDAKNLVGQILTAHVPITPETQ
jgi:hypothetical protein